MKPNIRIARGQPTTVDIHVIHLPRGIKTPLSLNRGGVMKGFVQGADRQQTTLLPECLDDW
ncbi:MAG TPA: hypothetical protein VK148_07625, partial [Xanthobacteraceae bacterium]|nr:hypothetical protein [Xanthobacteraceae bacterium]